MGSCDRDCENGWSTKNQVNLKINVSLGGNLDSFSGETSLNSQTVNVDMYILSVVGITPIFNEFLTQQLTCFVSNPQVIQFLFPLPIETYSLYFLNSQDNLKILTIQLSPIGMQTFHFQVISMSNRPNRINLQEVRVQQW